MSVLHGPARGASTVAAGAACGRNPDRTAAGLARDSRLRLHRRGCSTPTSKRSRSPIPPSMRPWPCAQMLVRRGIVVTGKARAKHQQPNDPGSYHTEVLTPDPCDTMNIAGGTCTADCDAPATPSGAMLASHTSAPLGEDVVLTNKVSQNLHAELFLHNLGLHSALWRRLHAGRSALHSGLSNPRWPGSRRFLLPGWFRPQRSRPRRAPRHGKRFSPMSQSSRGSRSGRLRCPTPARTAR